MTATNRVDELRKRYHENPKRFFAPLANEYRKTGFIDRAILLCEKHLAEQSDNMNGLVVYGQCLFESGRHADANAPFEGALALDPENLIALRHLGDIARLQDDQAGARKWYERLLEFDRRNDEVQELLAQVGGGESREPSSGPSRAQGLVTVAPSVRVAQADVQMHGDIDLGGTPEPPMTVPDVPMSMPLLEPEIVSSTAPTVVRGAVRAPLPDSTAPTVEIPDPSRAPRRASILDIAFDFGEGAAEFTGASDLGMAAPVLEPLIARVPTPVTARSVTPQDGLLELDTAPAPDEAPVGGLIELAPEPMVLGGLPRIDGLEAAEFSAEVEPLADFETSEFQSGTVAPLAGLESDGLGFDEPPSGSEADSAGLTLDEVPEEQSFGTPSLLADEEPGEEEFHSVGLDELSSVSLDDVDLVAEDEVVRDIASGTDEPAALPEESDPAVEVPGGFVTETMAKLYVEQGFKDRAIEVYRQLVEQDPRDVGLRERLEALEASTRTSLGFEPTVAEEPEEVTPPANAMLADVSFADVALVTPRETPPAAAPVSPPPAAVPSGPTAREFLRAFAQRALTPAFTPAVPGARAPAGALDGLFGSEVAPEDERAAHRLAAVGATSGPSGGSAMDSLFGEGPSAPAPELIARVSRASERLKFDQFFTPPSAGEAAPAAAAPDTSEAQGMPMDEDVESDDDDLDQFQGWLRGLSE